jgi:predicted RNase H-like HicB family nuclease
MNLDLDRHPRVDADTRDHALTLEVVVAVAPEDGLWHAWCPTLLDYGVATWAATREEALGHIREVVGMIVARMAEDGVPVPTAPADQEQGPAAGELVVITVGAPAPDVLPPA